MDSEGPDQTARMRRVISAFTFSLCPHLSMIDAFSIKFRMLKSYIIHYVVSKVSVSGR